MPATRRRKRYIATRGGVPFGVLPAARPLHAYEAELCAHAAALVERGVALDDRVFFAADFCSRQARSSFRHEFSQGYSSPI
jgi:hypothetical protein